MEPINTIKIDSDIKVFYVTANSFPEGIMEAHRQLHSIVPFSTERKYFGISRPENGIIVYRAATEETYSSEAEELECDTLILKSGNYISVIITNYMDDLLCIDRTFQELLSNPDIDPEGYCIEWYLSQKEVNCMLRLKD